MVDNVGRQRGSDAKDDQTRGPQRFDVRRAAEFLAITEAGNMRKVRWSAHKLRAFSRPGMVLDSIDVPTYLPPLLKLQIGERACGHASAQDKRNDLRQDPPECIFDLHDQVRRSESYRSRRIEPIGSLEVGIPWA